MTNVSIEPLIRKLKASGDLAPADIDVLKHVRITRRQLDNGEDLVRVGDRMGVSALVVEGMLCRNHVIGGGTRQIMSFHIEGDIPDLQSVFLKHMDHNVTAIGPAVVGLMPHEDLERAFLSSPPLAARLWRETLIDAAIFRQWISNVGGRSALAATAHLLCELVMRAKAVGLVDENNSYKLPLTQQDMADALGISLVHINRTLKKLRELGLAHWEVGRLTVLDWDGLKKTGDFDPFYLHLAK
jgi:CRP-like cAMP-binding protein